MIFSKEEEAKIPFAPLKPHTDEIRYKLSLIIVSWLQLHWYYIFIKFCVHGRSIRMKRVEIKSYS